MKKHLLVLLAAFALTPSAHALTYLGVKGGLAFPQGSYTSNFNSVAPVIGAELLFGFEDLKIGAFFDDYFYSSSGTSFSGRFFGATARLGLMPTPIFVDARVGLDNYSNGSDTVVGFGVGVGYKFMLAPFTSLSPRVGYNYMPAQFSGYSNSLSVIDTALILSFGI